MEVPENASDTDPMNARFQDGSVKAIFSITVGIYKTMHPTGPKAKAKAGAKASGPPKAKPSAGPPPAPPPAGPPPAPPEHEASTSTEPFEGKRDNIRVWVIARTDQQPQKEADRLICIKWSQKPPQLIQVNIKIFDSKGGSAEANESLAIKWCNGVADRFCKGELSKDDITTEKAKLLAEYGFTGKKFGALKRPASAIAPSPPAPPKASEGAEAPPPPPPKATGTEAPSTPPRPKTKAKATPHAPIPPPPSSDDD
eukprot:6998884-Pyramimonas_sp.AAC.1